VIIGRSSCGLPRSGETGIFERHTENGQIVVQDRDQEVVLDVAGSLVGTPLDKGDKVRFDRELYMAFAKLPGEEGRRYFEDEVPEIGRDRIGGQDKNLETVFSVLHQVLLYPEVARQYGLNRRVSVLLVGAPGLGKTLMARITASEMTRMSGRACRLAVVKPAEWYSPWVGVTEANIRNCFQALRKEAKDGFGILFLDEIEAVGRIRGVSTGSLHADRFLAALLAELDGFGDRGNVAIISATNRKDLVDPALLERLSEVEIRLNRPDVRAARSIFQIHLPSDLPYSSNGCSPEATRQEMIERTVSRLYSPNGDNALCTIQFRDGKTRTLTARDLASGRLFEQVCWAARRTAFCRKTMSGMGGGLNVADIDKAISDAMDRLRTAITPENAHAHLEDIPDGRDVVGVIPVGRQAKDPHRYVVLNPE
jgi:SpoVK/Ycf46/Vps4 family AAA+-type ATPase